MLELLPGFRCLPCGKQFVAYLDFSPPCSCVAFPCDLSLSCSFLVLPGRSFDRIIGGRGTYDDMAVKKGHGREKGYGREKGRV